jgi:hypothetical protein
VGYFDATRKVNSDARWIRCAYLMGKRFVKINEDLVFYSTQGLSSASQSSMKDLIVSESASLIRLCFPFLTTQEVEKIYLSNFNSHSLDDVSRIYENLRGYCDVFDVSLKEFLIFNFENKSSYSWRPDDIKHNLRLINTCKVFGIDFSKITFDGEDAALGFLKKIEEFGVIKRTRPNVVLHFARDFSSPSETFIHEFVTDLNKSEEKNCLLFAFKNKLTNDTNFIKPANPRQSLKMFGGYQTIEEFRKDFKILAKNSILIYPPSKPLKLYIEEEYKNNTFKFQQGHEYKIKRTKPITRNANNLNNLMKTK